MPEGISTVSSKEVDVQQLADDDTIPEPTFGRAMYVWVDCPHGYRLRKLVPREEWSTCWIRCPPLSRRYFYFIEEWDLQIDVTNEILHDDKFAPVTIVELDNRRVATHQPESSQDRRDALQPQLVIRSQPFTNIHEEARRYFEEEVIHTYGSTVLTNSVETPPLERVLRDHYGFRVQGVYEQHPRMRLHGRVSANTENLPAAMSRLELKAYSPHDYETAVLHLFNYVVYHSNRLVAFPPLWDFNPSSVRAITHHPYFDYVRVEEGFHLIGVREQPLVDQWYLLAIPDTCTVLQVFREKETKLLAIVRSLLNCGMEFETLKCVHTILPEMMLREQPSVGLGSFRMPPEFDVATYVAYEKAKRNVLSSGMGRVALMHGGIVWHLAQGLVKIKDVTKGLNFTQSTTFGELEDCQLVADGLPQADEDIICGVYHIRTVIFSSLSSTGTNLFMKRTAGQDTEISWWPKMSIWRNSGYNVGYWSADCEKWYQDRLTQIRNGKAMLYMALKWRADLRLKSSHTAEFVKGINKMVDMLLEGDSSYWMP